MKKHYRIYDENFTRDRFVNSVLIKFNGNWVIGINYYFTTGYIYSIDTKINSNGNGVQYKYVSYKYFHYTGISRIEYLYDSELTLDTPASIEYINLKASGRLYYNIMAGSYWERDLFSRNKWLLLVADEGGRPAHEGKFSNLITIVAIIAMVAIFAIGMIIFKN